MGVNVINNETQDSFSVGGAVGREKRRSLDNRLQFIYDIEFIGNLGVVSLTAGTTTIDNGNGSTTTVTGSSRTLFTPSLGVGFVLGVQYNISPKWYVSAELIPTLTASGTFGTGVSIYGFQAGFNSSNVGVTGAYRF